MVKYAEIRKSNARIDASTAPRTAVFVGGTSGIGKITLAALAKLGTPFKAYVIVRKSSTTTFEEYASEIQEANSNATIIPIEGEVSLVAEAQRICDHLKTLESSLDLLFLTTGYAPFGGRENTTEGLPTSHALSFYSRICFIENLLPLLRASDRARVINVGAAGIERASFLDEDDLSLEKPGARFEFWSQAHVGMMISLYTERLAEDPQNRSIVFIHNRPGIVRTGNLFRGWQEGGWGITFAIYVMDPLLRLFEFTFEESAERHVYQVTSASFGGRGVPVDGVVPGRTTKGEESGGLFLVNPQCDAVMNEKEMAKLRVTAQGKVWEKTLKILRSHFKNSRE